MSDTFEQAFHEQAITDNITPLQPDLNLIACLLLGHKGTTDQRAAVIRIIKQLRAEGNPTEKLKQLIHRRYNSPSTRPITQIRPY